MQSTQNFAMLNVNTILTVSTLLRGNIAELYTITSNNSSNVAFWSIGTFSQQLFISKTVSTKKHSPIGTQ